ncbi:MAG: (Fe-S)-binding protein [Faecalicatena sp.]|uniref:(Fe-S)-binding protein n=1 Tax=Faecalicatena sp. TaxID=2005360 RepID=UPI002583DB39|nr:(Fe-S)-binding protein [Faecalicatena sp.]MCI6464632.1 (Fe-S)-binding protein [Faecalicatena sp.]MDY5618209.1 (Fe-S)-binding protein [Lachnospiraceae bacterium]
MNEHEKYFHYIEDQCLRCHSCRCYHSTSLIGEVCYGELATLLLNHELKEFPDSIFGCHQCGLCLKKCPKNFNAKEFMFHARAWIEAEDKSFCNYYNGVRVDKKENQFSKQKRENSIHYVDTLLEEGDCKRLFVPGCHMTSGFPELTKKVTSFLQEKNIADGMTAVCCGNPLYAAGLYEEFKNYIEKMDELYKKHHTKEILTPCPSCYDFNKRVQNMGYLQGIEVKCLSKELAEHKIKINRKAFPEEYKISFHDSCPDRKNGVFAESIRRLYQDFETEEMEHIKENTLCCGCGGLVPPYSQTISTEGKKLKKQDFEKTGSDCLITTCFNCYKGLKSVVPVHQYLEDLIMGNEEELAEESL